MKFFFCKPSKPINWLEQKVVNNIKNEDCLAVQRACHSFSFNVNRLAIAKSLKKSFI